MCFDFDKQLLEMLDDGAVDGATKICVRVCDLSGLVADTVEHVLREHKISTEDRKIETGGACL